MAIKKVTVEVSAKGLTETTSAAKKLNSELDRAEKPRKVRAASAALSASEPTVATGLTRGTAAAGNRGDSRDFGRQAQGLGGLVHLYATFAANVFAVGAAFTALSKAADFSNMQKAADILSLKVGVSINGLAKDMKNLTDGAISMSDALSQASLAASAGLNSSQIKELTTVAKGASIALGRDMADAMQRVFRGTVKIEPELLDELGLMVKVDDANKKYAKTLNKTVSSLTDYERRQAFVNAVTSQGIAKYKELANQTANPYSKLLASISDLGTTTLNVISTALGPFINLLSSSPSSLLLGLGAIVALLLKQAVPALSDMSKGWEEADSAAKKSLQTQKDILQQRKTAILETNKAQENAATVEFTKVRDKLLDSTKGSSLQSYKEIKTATALSNFIGVSPEGIDVRTKEISTLLEKAKKTIKGKLISAAAELSKVADISSSDYAKIEKKQANLLKAQLGADNLINGLEGLSSAAKKRAESNNTLVKTDDDISKLTSRIQKYELLGNRVSAIRSAVQATESLGIGAGFSDLSNSLKKGIVNAEGATVQFSGLNKVLLGIKGTFSIITTSMASLLGVFSIWAGVITVLVPLLSGLLTWMGLLTDHAEVLSSSLDKVAESLSLNEKTNSLLDRSSSLAESFKLSASAAMSYAEALDQIAISQKKFNDFTDNAGIGTKYIEDMKNLFSLGSAGVLGSSANEGIIKQYEQRVSTDTAFASKNVDNFKNSNGNYDTVRGAFMKANAGGFGDTTKVIEKILAALADPELSKSSKSFAENSNAMSANLKDLDTISSEYLITLQNQSKHLKALNSLSSGTVNLFKTLGNKEYGKSAAGISVFLEGITEQFQTMSEVPLSDYLQKVKTNLENVQQVADHNYNAKLSSIPSNLSSSDRAKQIDQLEKDRKTEIEQRSAEVLKDRTRVEIELANQSLRTSKRLAELGAASANASVEQAKLSRSLKQSQFIASFSDRSQGSLKTTELAAERKKVAIENSAQITNVNSLKNNLTTSTKSLQGELGVTGGTQTLEYLKNVAQAAIDSRDTSTEKRGSLTGLLNNIESTKAAIKISNASIEANTLTLPTKLESTVGPKIAELEAIQSTITATINNNLLDSTNALNEEFKGIVGMGSETVDALFAYKSSLISADSELASLATASILATLKLEELKTGLNKAGLTGADKTKAEQAIATQSDIVKGTNAKTITAQQAKEKLTQDFELNIKQQSLKDTNQLKSRSLELDETIGKISKEDADIQRVKLALSEDIFRAEEQYLNTGNATLLVEVAKKQATADQAIEILKVSKELRVQEETLSRIDTLFSSNKASTGLLNATQIQIVNRAYTEILAKQQQAEQLEVNQLTGNEKIIAQEELRVKFLEKQLQLQENILEAKERGTQPYQIDKNLLSERFELDAKKFRDTLDSYNKTVVGASYKAVDTFVDGITNAVKNLDFNLKNIIRDTVFAFDDMMMEYAGNQLKAIMKDAISQYFHIDMRTGAEKSADAQLKVANEQKGLQLRMANTLDSIANNKAIQKDSATQIPSFIQNLDILGNSQEDMLKSQELGFSTADLKSWGGSVEYASKEQTKASSLIDTAATGMESVVRLFSSGSTNLISGLSRILSSIFSSSSANSSSNSGLSSILGGLFGGTTSGSMFAAQEAGFSSADLASWGGSMTGGANIFGFATGGDFKVGGRDGVDKNLVQFMATKGEQVIVKTPEQQKESSGTSMQVVNHFTITGGTTSRESQQQISAKVGASIQRAMARNN